jgi:hypothetical protein
MKTILPTWMRRGRLALQEVAPYVGLLAMPGGSLIGLAAWLFARGSLAFRGGPRVSQRRAAGFAAPALGFGRAKPAVTSAVVAETTT